MAEFSEDQKLVDVFNSVWTLYHDIDTSMEASTSEKLQKSIASGLKTLEFLSQSVEGLSMFSENEELDEVATSDLRYFLISALHASLTLKKSCDVHARVNILKDSLSFFIKYLKLCLSYEMGNQSEIEELIANKNVDDEPPKINSKPDLIAMNAARDVKIAKYRKAKLQAQQIKEYEGRLHDEEISRKYWMLQITKWIDSSMDEMSSIRFELNMLNKMKDVPRSELDESRKNAPKGMEPFILTKDKLQASVFGAGYPSIPTVTLEEYFEKEVAAGRLPDQAAKPASDHKAEAQSDSDDEDKVKKQREFDDWKDSHRRGEGNRKNMG